MATHTVPTPAALAGATNYKSVALQNWWDATVNPDDIVNFPTPINTHNYGTDDLQSLSIAQDGVTINGNGAMLYRTDPQAGDSVVQSPKVVLVQLLDCFGVKINDLYGRGGKTQIQAFDHYNGGPENRYLEAHHWMGINGGGSHTITRCHAAHFFGDYASIHGSGGGDATYPGSTTTAGSRKVVLDPATSKTPGGRALRPSPGQIGCLVTGGGIPPYAFVDAVPDPADPRADSEGPLTFRWGTAGVAGVGLGKDIHSASGNALRDPGVGPVTIQSRNLTFNVLFDNCYAWDFARHIITPQGIRGGRNGIDPYCTRVAPDGSDIGIWIRNLVGLYYQHHFVDATSDVDYPNQKMNVRFGQKPEQLQNNDGDARDGKTWGSPNVVNKELGGIYDVAGPFGQMNALAYPLQRVHIPALNKTAHFMAARWTAAPAIQEVDYAPRIVNVAFEEITATTAVVRIRATQPIVHTLVSWSVNKEQPGTGLLEPIIDKTDGFTYDPDVANHTLVRVKLTGLPPSRAIWVVPKVFDASGQSDITNAQRFDTLAGTPVPTKPLIDNPRIVSTTATTIRVAWGSDQPVFGLLTYAGPDGVQHAQPTITPAAFTFDVTLTGLTALTRYVLAVGVWNANGSATTFLAADTGAPAGTAPNFVAAAITDTTPTTLEVTLGLDAPAIVDMIVVTGGAGEAGPTSPLNNIHVIDVGSAVPPGPLASATDYDLIIVGHNAGGSDQLVLHGRTDDPPLGLPVILNPRAGVITADSIEVRWETENPADGGLSLRDPGTGLYNAVDNNTGQTAHRLFATGLPTPDTLYDFLLSTLNASGPWFHALTLKTADEGSTTDGPGVIASDVIPGGTFCVLHVITDASCDVRLRWATAAEYPTLGAYHDGPFLEDFDTDHTGVISGLQPGTDYVGNALLDNDVDSPTIFVFNFTTLGVPPIEEEPPVVEALARFARVTDGGIVTGDRSVTVTAREDPRDHTAKPLVYCHSAGNDWLSPIRDPLFYGPVWNGFPTGLGGIQAMVEEVFDYCLERGYAIVSGEYRHHAAGAGAPWQHWGCDDGGVDSINEHLLHATADAPLGLGTLAPKALVVGYSMGGPSAIAYAIAYPERVAGILTFAGANALSLARGTDLVHVRDFVMGAGTHTTAVNATVATFHAGMVGNHFVTTTQLTGNANLTDETHVVSGYTSPTAITISPGFSPGIAGPVDMFVWPADRSGGFYDVISDAYTDDTHNPSAGTAPDDGDWAVIEPFHDGIAAAGTIDPMPPVLALHAETDYTVPIAQAEAFAAAWPTAELINVGVTPDLGHFTGAFRDYAGQIHAFINSLDWG